LECADYGSRFTLAAVKKRAGNGLLMRRNCSRRSRGLVEMGAFEVEIYNSVPHSTIGTAWRWRSDAGGVVSHSGDFQSIKTAVDTIILSATRRA